MLSTNIIQQVYIFIIQQYNMTNFKVANNIRKKTSFKNLKTALKPNGKTPENLEPPIEGDNPLFYCSLCSKPMKYSDLIDGCRCCLCKSDLFIILWNEYKKRLWRTQFVNKEDS